MKRTTRAACRSIRMATRAVTARSRVWLTRWASTRRVANSAATRRATCLANRLKTIFLHPPVQRGACDAEIVGRVRHVAGVALERLLDGPLLHFCQGAAQPLPVLPPPLALGRVQREVAQLQGLAVAQDDRALERMPQGAHV